MEVGGSSSSSDHGHGGGMNMGEGFSSMRMNMTMPPPPPPPLMPSPPPLPYNNPPYCLEMNTLFPPPPLSSSSNNNNMAFYNDNKNRIKQNPQVAAPGNCYFMMINNNNTTTTTSTSDQNNNNNNDSCSLLMRAKIMAHPHYPRLLAAYINCHKVGAPPEVVKRLDEILSADKVNRSRSSSTGGGGGVLLGEDPSLDQFMEAYSEMLIKYEQQLTKPLQEAMLFLSSLHSQLKTLDTPLTNSPPPPPHSSSGQNGSSDGEIDANNNDNYIDPQAEDRELKLQLLRKYSGCLGSLKQEFMKKRKKGKLPKEAREQLLDWWSRHYKWPYPSESQKMALAETTGLDQKQINNWFINQRKRHWKPSEEMQFVELDGSNHPHHQYYIENVLNNNPYYMDYYTQPSLL